MATVDTRTRIVEAADRLFYENGFVDTSFGAIADQLALSRGNFYYHFKAKDDLLAAVLDHRIALTRDMIAQWSIDAATPQQRILLFIEIVERNQGDIQQFGCPVGALVAELSRLRHAQLPQVVELFTLFREWLAKQFVALGATDSQADDYAMHVLAFSQGVAALSNAYADPEFTHREVERISEWLMHLTDQIGTRGDRCS